MDYRSLTCVRDHSYDRIHTGVGHTNSESAQQFLTQKNPHKFVLCSWCGSNLGSLDLESDALPTEPSCHHIIMLVTYHWQCWKANAVLHCAQDALEILEKHAEFRSEGSDDSRALAFRRASCVLKSLPFRVEKLSRVEGLKDIGRHGLKVIQVGCGE